MSFVVANTTAVLAALYLAFYLDLERPYWAMFTVFIIAKPLAGAVRSKGVYRFAGTLVGASMAVLLIPPLVQSPLLLCLAVMAWVAVCLYVALLDRTPRTYAALLAGYTVAIIGFSVVDQPQQVFDTAVARVEEISLGILCCAVAHSVFFPRNVTEAMHERIAAALMLCRRWMAGALQNQVPFSEAEAQRRLSQLVTELHLLYTHVAFETSEVPRARPLLRGLLDRLALYLPLTSTTLAAAEALERAQQQRPELQEQMAAVARWLQPADSPLDTARAAAGATIAEGARVRRGLRAALRVPPATPAWQGARECAVLSGLARLVRTVEEAETYAQALRESARRLPPRLQREAATSGRRELPRDHGLALMSAAAAAVAMAVACVLWIAGSWPEGAVAAQFAAITCALFATFDNPAKPIGAAVVALLIVLPLGALFEFAIIPRADGFVSLALVLAPMIALFSLMQTSEKLEGGALVLAIGFSGALALQGTYRADFAVFINSNAAEIAGCLIAIVTNRVLRTLDPLWNARRIAAAGRRSVRRLARHGYRGSIREWTLQMFDRVGLIAQRLQHAEVGVAVHGPGAIPDALRDLRVGLSIAVLRCQRRHLRVQTGLDIVLDSLGRRYGMGPALADAGARLGAQIDAALAATVAQVPGRRATRIIAALAALKLDLDPVSA